MVTAVILSSHESLVTGGGGGLEASPPDIIRNKETEAKAKPSH